MLSMFLYTMLCTLLAINQLKKIIMAENKKYYNAKIVINIKDDKEAYAMYEEFIKKLYSSDLIYFDHEIQLENSYHSGFRNNLNKHDI